MDDFAQHQPPFAAQAEQSVLGSMLIDPACVPDMLTRLRAEDFYFPQNRVIFETFVSMFVGGAIIDAVTVQEALREAGRYEECGGQAYLMQLMEVTPTAAHAGEYAAILRDKTLLRQTAAAADRIRDLVTRGEGSARDIVEHAERLIYEIRQGREIRDLYHIQAVLYDVFAHLENLSKNKGALAGVPTGIENLDRTINGLNRSELILLASRPSMGKTSFALNIAYNAAKASGKAVAFFQLEMSREQLVMRLLSSAAGVELTRLRSGEISPEDWSRLALASSMLARLELYVDDNPAIGVADMKSKCRRLGDKLGLVVIDYLQLMTGSKRFENRTTEVSDISRSLKIMAKELNIPVLCLSQLSRATEQRADKKPMLSDLRESGAIEQDADIVMFLYRDDYYNKEAGGQKNSAELIIAKNRHGETRSVPLQWQGQFTRFGSVETRHEQPY